MLAQFRSLSHLLAQKDELKAKQPEKPKDSAGGSAGGSAQGLSQAPGGGGKGMGGSAPGGADRNQVKNALTAAVDIIKKVFNVNAPKGV